jgi:DNA adenine methylase
MHHADAIELIRRHDGASTLFYLDPPYLPESRTARRAYTYEMSSQDHSALLECIAGVRGMVILSGYRSALYDHALASWERHEIEKPNNAGQGKTKERRVEVLWLNPACERFVLA